MLPALPADRANLRVVDEGPSAGVSQKRVLEDEHGNKYFWKVPRPGQFSMERTSLANELRQQAGEGVLEMARHRVGDQEGMLTPLLSSGTPLDYDVPRLTRAESDAALADMPWAFFLGNWDTKPDQYLRLGGSVLNTDWDQTLSDFAARHVTYDRHTTAHFSPLVPPIQAALLLEHVHGRGDLDLSAITESAQRIASLTDEQLRAAVAPLVAAAYGPDKAGLPGLPTPGALLDALRDRRDRVVDETERLVSGIEEERRRNANPMSLFDLRLLGSKAADARLSASIGVARSPVLDVLYAARRLLG